MKFISSEFVSLPSLMRYPVQHGKEISYSKHLCMYYSVYFRNIHTQKIEKNVNKASNITA